ncbi:MAG: DUF3726 domain-containing protein [Gammaproteobacteria bacterium]|nr:DUF3726 domain-containing protein [Gammaproteobacteria bacterium]
MIVCSLNEVEMYGRRAARGAGMAWGLAEEAGKAARWLVARGFPGVELLTSLLNANDGRPYEFMAPHIVNGRWQSGDETLCPICTGAALSDRIDLLARNQEISLFRVAFPLLLAPFLNQSPLTNNVCHELRWSSVRVSVWADGVAVDSPRASDLVCGDADVVKLTCGDTPDSGPTHRPRTEGATMPLSVWRALEALAGRTYVPATEESRRRGAGAGRTDND